MPKVGLIVVAALSVVFMIIIIILAAVYGGDDANCDSFYKAKDAERAAALKKQGPKMVHFPQIQKNTKLVKLNHTKANAYMKTIGYSMVGSADMQATVLRLDKGPALMYTHWYESILFVMDGSFAISNGSNFFTVAKEQMLYIPRGSEISYQSLVPTSYMYIVDQPPLLERATAIQKAMDQNPTTNGYPSLTALPTAMTYYNKLSFFGDKKGGDLSYLDDLLFSKVKGAGLTGGLYKFLKGPHLQYPYPYTEFKYIVRGEYHLTDGTGQKVIAKGGDLMYFPIGCDVRFESSNFGLGFFIGQRGKGEA